MKNVFIDGQAGTTGLQLAGRLSGHGAVNLLEIDLDSRKNVKARAGLMNEADVVFLCLPDQAAREAAGLVTNPETVIIDTSTANRVSPGWTYGFSELSKERANEIAHSKRIANPGCHATGFISLVYPLVKMGLIPKDYPFCCQSLTGYSGGGRKMIEQYEAAGRGAGLKSPRAYALGLEHKHLPEMQFITGIENPPLFEPVVCDFYSGMQVTVPIYTDLLPGRPGPDDFRRALTDFYSDSPLIRVCEPPSDGFLPANLMAGSDALNIYATGNARQVLLISLFDNLGKGAAGAAVQNMNLALGIDPMTSLNWEGA